MQRSSNKVKRNNFSVIAKVGLYWTRLHVGQTDKSISRFLRETTPSSVAAVQYNTQQLPLRELSIAQWL